MFLLHSEGQHQEEILAALHRALDIAEAAGVATLIPRILCELAHQSFLGGDLEDGFRRLAQARAVPEASRDAWVVLRLTMIESDALLKTGKLEAATRVAMGGLDIVRQGGLGNHFGATVILANAVEGLLGSGRTTEAAALIDPHTTGPVEVVQWPLHELRAEIDLLRGDVQTATQRLHEIEISSSLEDSRELGQAVAEVALWAGRPDEALEEIQRVLDRLAGSGWVILCGWLLAVGMRACADLAERARARHDQPAVRAALDAADNLVSWVHREHDVPFTDHPFVATIPDERATWDAERSRAAGASDPNAWSAAAERWEALGYRHRAAYACWRQAEALLARPHGSKEAAATVLSTAAGLAREHVPLTTAIRDLARRARIDPSVPAELLGQDERAVPARRFGLTDRELDVLRLLAEGRTNPEIAAALFISPRTASVHVSSILRKLDATTRVQAATVAERAGLLATGPTGRGAT